jgi:Ala-tRNA(Pro) deacylase
MDRQGSTAGGREDLEERERIVYEALDGLGISYERHEHPPVFTVEEAVVHWKDIRGAHCKNLFLRNKPGKRHYLVIAEHLRPVNLPALARAIGDSRLSFASDERLRLYLGVHPGEVSPFGLLADARREVRVVIDAGLRSEEFVSFHPNVNTATLTIAYADLLRFLAWRGNPVREELL